MSKNATYICKCNREYVSNSGLWKHKKMCSVENASVLSDEPNKLNDVSYLTNLVLEVVKSNNELQKQNQDFQLQMMDYCKSSSNIDTSFPTNTIKS